MVLKAGGDPLLENELGHRAYEYCANDEVKKLLDELNSIIAFDWEYGDRIISGKIIQNKICEDWLVQNVSQHR